MRSNCAFVAVASGRVEAVFVGEGQRDAAVLGGVGGGEKHVVRAVLHVLAVGLEHAAVRAGFCEHLAQRWSGPARARNASPRPFGQPGGVDVHDHVD